MVAVERISKRFPGVQALANVSLAFEPGECHALVGENGAGKSTLGKIIAGIYRPDAGQVIVDGTPVAFRSPLDAARAGVAVVHQELAFCPNLSVAENLHLGDLPRRGGWVRRNEMEHGTRRQLAAVGLDLDPWTPMAALSTAQEQLVQIAAAVGRGARVIVMDEPTSSLSQVEAERLFDILAQLRQQGVTVIYVSHRLEEVFRLCDRVSVLRDGRLIDTQPTSNLTHADIVRRMIGRDIEEYFPAHVGRPAEKTRLAVRDLASDGRFREVSFELRAGEVVGLAGLVGAGRSEIAQTIFGILPKSRGRVEIDGREVDVRRPSEAIAAGIGYVPEDRKRQGLVLTMNARENLTLAVLERIGAVSNEREQNSTGEGAGRYGAEAARQEPRPPGSPVGNRCHTRGGAGRYFVDYRAERRLVSEYIRRLHVRPADGEAAIAGLSGGNQQKIALAKWLAGRCPVLMLDEPTRGVDVGAKAEIHALIDRLATEGHAVLLISSELPEVLHLSTRILVIARSRLVGELSRAEATQQRLMEMMTGGTPNAVATGTS